MRRRKNIMLGSQLYVRKRENEGFGFSVRGDAPVVIAGVDPRSLAEVCTIMTLRVIDDYTVF